MRLSQKWWGLALALSVLLVSACGGPQPSESKPTDSKLADSGQKSANQGVGGATLGKKLTGNLIFGLSSEPPNIDPHVQSGTAARTVKLALYRGLVAYGPDGSIVMELAESVQPENDRTYNFKLRPGAKFHNGDPVTAADVVYSFDRMRDAKIGAYLAKDLSIIDKVEAVGDKAVKVVLKEPSATFMDKLALPEAAIVSKKFTEEKGGDLKRVETGAGPFKLKEWNKGVDLTVEGFVDYYKPDLPKLSTIKFVFYPDENLRSTALKTGDVDLVDYVPWKDMKSIETDPNLKLDSTVGPFMYLVFNMKKPPFDNPKVRQAISFAVNRQPILDAAFFGRGAPIWGMLLNEQSWAYTSENANYYKYDPEKARRLLAEAGYPNGFTATLLSTSQYGMHQQTAEVVQAELKKVGVTVKLELPDWATRVKKGAEGDYEFAVHGTAPDITDPDFYTTFLRSGALVYTTSAYFADDELDRLLDQGRSTLDKAARKKIYAQVEKRALELAPIVPLAWREQAFAYKKSVTGFQSYPGFLNFYSGLSLEKTAITK